jgi:hypothetical protein
MATRLLDINGLDFINVGGNNDDYIIGLSQLMDNECATFNDEHCHGKKFMYTCKPTDVNDYEITQIVIFDNFSKFTDYDYNENTNELTIKTDNIETISICVQFKIFKQILLREYERPESIRSII